MTPITRPCPHCGTDYDITRRLNGDVCWCSCGKWFRVVCRLNGVVYLSKCDAPDGTEATQDPTADAALVAEMSAMRVELEAAKEDNAMLLSALREIDFDFDKLSPRNQRLLNRIRQAEHPGRALMAELTKRMSDLEQERDAARAVVEIVRRGFGTAEDITKAEAFDPVALTRAIRAYDQATKNSAVDPAPEPPSAG